MRHIFALATMDAVFAFSLVTAGNADMALAKPPLLPHIS